jgi:hypothetical protein
MQFKCRVEGHTSAYTFYAPTTSQNCGDNRSTFQVASVAFPPPRKGKSLLARVLARFDVVDRESLRDDPGSNAVVNTLLVVSRDSNRPENGLFLVVVATSSPRPAPVCVWPHTDTNTDTHRRTVVLGDALNSWRRLRLLTAVAASRTIYMWNT